MKLWLLSLSALCGLLALFAVPVALAERSPESHIYMDNKSSGFVWVTAYAGASCIMAPGSDVYCFRGGKIEGAWCVPPGILDKHGLRVKIYEVRAEVSLGGCQHHPVLLNQLRGFPYSKDYSGYTMTYFVKDSNGKYTYGNY